MVILLTCAYAAASHVSRSAQTSGTASTQGAQERGRRTAKEEAEVARLRSQSRRANDSAVQSALLDKPGDSVTGFAKLIPDFAIKAQGLELCRPLLVIKAFKTDKVFKLLLTPGHGHALKRTQLARWESHQICDSHSCSEKTVLAERPFMSSPSN